MTGCAPLRAITAGEIDAFVRDGYVVLRGVVSPDWLAPLEDACHWLRTAPEMLDITEETLRSVMPATSGQLFGVASYARVLAERGHFFMSFNTARRDRAVLEFALLGAMGGIAATIMRSTTARFLDDILFVKEPGTHEPTEWHDDDAGSIASGAQRCSLWISLRDVPENAGPLRFLRGSHGRFAGWRQRGMSADSLIAAHAADVETCPIQVGDVIAHNLTTIHGASPNTSASSRCAWAFRFAGDDARFLLRPARRESREWYRLEDGEPLAGPRFPVAWPPERLDRFDEFGAP